VWDNIAFRLQGKTERNHLSTCHGWQITQLVVPVIDLVATIRVGSPVVFRYNTRRETECKGVNWVQLALDIALVNTAVNLRVPLRKITS
jgi:hypothetical protein